MVGRREWNARTDHVAWTSSVLHGRQSERWTFCHVHQRELLAEESLPEGRVSVTTIPASKTALEKAGFEPSITLAQFLPSEEYLTI